MDLRLSPAQTTAKVNFKIHSHYLHLIGGRMSPRATLDRDPAPAPDPGPDPGPGPGPGPGPDKPAFRMSSS